MKSPILMALLGGKAKDKEPSAEEETDVGGSMLDEFIDAVIAGDKESAKAAFKSAVKSCSSAAAGDEYEDDDAEEE